MSLKSEIYGLLYNGKRLCADCAEAGELLKSLREMEQRLEQPLRVAVVGMMKAGKSTFMNALMGADILYTGNLETTYTVGWFRYGEQPFLTICFRNGETMDAPFKELQKWSVREYEKENPGIHDVKYLIIHYPSEVLKQLEFIDTPGLNSVYGTDAENTLDFLSIKGSEETVYEASAADAVIYAFSKSAAGFDREILQAFHSGGAGASPINSVGILTKVDATGIWDIFSAATPVEAAKPVADTVMQHPDMKNLLFAVFPVCAKVMEGYAKLTARDWEALYSVARTDEDTLADLLFDAEQFAVCGEAEFEKLAPAPRRKRLMGMLGQYGILEIAKLIRSGKKPDEIETILKEACGIQAVRDILLSHFGNRVFLIKSRYIFTHLRALTHQLMHDPESSAGLRNICEEIREEIDGIMSSVQTLKELKILQMYYNGQVEFFSEEEKEDFLCVTGEYGRSAEARLGMKEGYTVRQLARRAREKVDFWHERASGFMLPGAYVEAAATLARSYEQMYLHLSALSEE